MRARLPEQAHQGNLAYARLLQGRHTVAKLRHLAIATDDPDGTAQFYVDAFEFVRVRTASGIWGRGHILSDGTINLAILQFSTNEAAGVEKGTGYRGLHHIGFEVEDVDHAADRVTAA